MSNVKKVSRGLRQPTNYNHVIGMLHIVEIRMVTKNTGEKIKQRLLLVGCEAADIERKLKWIFDAEKYSQFSISSVEKVREKIHILTTIVTSNEEAVSLATIKRKENTAEVFPAPSIVNNTPPKLFAIGITSTMVAADESHALRKLGKAIIAKCSPVKSTEGPQLSSDSVLQIEEIPFASGYAEARDVSAEINRAHIVRG